MSAEVLLIALTVLGPLSLVALIVLIAWLVRRSSAPAAQDRHRDQAPQRR